MRINFGLGTLLFGPDAKAHKVARPKTGLGPFQAASPLPETGATTDWALPQYGNYYATSVPAYRAIKLRADAIVAAPLRVYRHMEDGATEPVPADHWVQSLLDLVNPWWTAIDLWRATETYLCLWGSAFWFVERVEGIGPDNRRWQQRLNHPNGNTGAMGPRFHIWPLRPDRMRVIPDTSQGTNQYILGYKYTHGTKTVALTPDEIVWFRYFNPLDEYAGLAPIAPARSTLDMGTNAVTFNAAFFKNGAMPQDLIFIANGPLVDEEVQDFYQRLEKRHQGVSKAHRPMIWDMSQGAEPKRLGLTQRDMEFMAALNFTVEDAARVWGIPPPKMYSQVASTYNNVKQADIDFYTSTIASEWTFLASEVNELLMPILGERDLFVQFDTSNVLPLQEALAEQHGRERLDVQQGILTVNEVRAQRGLVAVPWGDTWWAPVGMMPADSMPDSSVLEQPMGRLWTGHNNGYKHYLPQDTLDDLSLDHLALTFEKRLTASEKRFKQLQKTLFQQQRQAVLSALHHSQSEGWPGGDRWITQKLSLGKLFNPTDWLKRFRESGLPVITAQLTLSAQEHGRDFQLGTFNVNNPQVQEWLEERVIFWADHVNEETARLLMSEIEEALKLGESIPDIQTRIEKVFDFNDKFRSERIARTEVVAASNEGHLAIYEQSGMVSQKMWIAAMDERTRKEHALAHRQVVLLHSNFTVGGEELEAPGIGGSAGNVINCRCTVVPIIANRNAHTNNHAQIDHNGDKPSDTPTIPVPQRKRTIQTIERDDNLVPIRVVTEEIQESIEE